MGRRKIGGTNRCFVIAEIGVNHNGDFSTALELIDAAAAAGADAAKFQTFDPQTLAIRNAPTAGYQRARTGAESQRAMLEKLALSRDVYPELIARCASLNIEFLSSPFSQEDADFLARLDVPAFKIPSGELTNLPLLQHTARFRKPMLVSTGMATEVEVARAVATIREIDDPPIVLLHCVSVYPAPITKANVRAMVRLRDAFGLEVGFSDHVTQHEAALAAVALGAKVVERHLTLDSTAKGPDHAISSSPEDLTSYINRIRHVESALGHGVKEPAEEERDVRDVARKSVAAAVDIDRHHLLTTSDLTLQRPGTGVPPSAMSQLVGKRTKGRISAGTLIEWEMVE